MQTLISIQQWLYRSMGQGLGDVAVGSPRAVFVAMSAAVLFGALHALMRGHGKTVLVSYHLGQDARPIDSFANGAILAVTHVGLAILLVLAGFAVISKVFAYSGRTPQFEAASGALVALIGCLPALALRRKPAPLHDKAERPHACFRDGHDPLPAHDIHHELCAGARHPWRRASGDGGNDRRNNGHDWRYRSGGCPRTHVSWHL